MLMNLFYPCLLGDIIVTCASQILSSYLLKHKQQIVIS